MSITVQHIKESLCTAHIYAISAMAGVSLGVSHINDYGVDGNFNSVIKRQSRLVVSGFPLDFQAKSTVNWTIANGFVVYDLESKTYNDIVSRTAAETTLLLVLLCLPNTAKDWHSVTADCTVLKNCCYWHVIKGSPIKNENSTKRIKIPVDQVLTPQSLVELLAFERQRRETQSA